MKKSYNIYGKNINNNRIISSVLVCFMLVGLAAYGIYFNTKSSKTDRILQQQYQRTFTDMSDYVNKAENYLLKAMAAGTPAGVSNMLEAASKCSSQAESCLAALPINQHSTEKISNYLVQLGDIAESWSHRAKIGGKLTDEEYQTLSSLYGYAQDLTGILASLGENLEKNSYTWGSVDKNTLKRISEPFTDYPELTYNGKYSVHMANSQPKGLTGYDMDREQCRSKATKFFSKICNCPAEEIGFEYCGDNSLGNIDTFCFKMNCPEKISAHIDVTKKGAKLYSMNISRDIANANLSPEQGIEAGKSFLKSLGMNNMTETFYSTEDNTVTVTYAYEKDDVIYYPDYVKVKIALDNGTPIAYEAHSYIVFHSENAERLSKASISKEAAQKMLSSHLELENVREVVLPNNYGGEYHAYEFKGSVEGHPVLVYVNADDGSESDIMLIYENEDGFSVMA